MADLEDSSRSVAETSRRATTRRWILAGIMLMLYIILQVSSSQLTNYVFVAQNIHFQAPTLFTFIKLGIRIFVFPGYLAILVIVNTLRRRPTGVGKSLSHCISILGPSGLSIRNICTKVMPAGITMLGHQLAYTYCLAYLTTAIGSAMLALSVTISYILSWIILKVSPILVKCIFVMVSLAGISLIAHASFTSQFPANALVGTIAAVVSVFSLCFHQILFRRAFPGADLEQISFALELMFIFITAIFLPIPIILKVTGVEIYDINEMPYGILLTTWLLSAANSTAYGYGLILSSSHFMSIGELLNLALNSGIDVSIRHLPMPATQITGTVLVALAFIVLIQPDHLLSLNLRHIICRLNVFRHESLTLERLPSPPPQHSSYGIAFHSGSPTKAVLQRSSFKIGPLSVKGSFDRIRHSVPSVSGDDGMLSTFISFRLSKWRRHSTYN